MPLSNIVQRSDSLEFKVTSVIGNMLWKYLEQIYENKPSPLRLDLVFEMDTKICCHAKL